MLCHQYIVTAVEGTYNRKIISKESNHIVKLFDKITHMIVFKENRFATLHYKVSASENEITDAPLYGGDAPRLFGDAPPPWWCVTLKHW